MKKSKREKFEGYTVPAAQDETELENAVSIAPLRFIHEHYSVCRFFSCSRISCEKCIWGGSNSDPAKLNTRRRWLEHKFSELINPMSFVPVTFKGKLVPIVTDVLEFEAANYSADTNTLDGLCCAGVECQSGKCADCLLADTENMDIAQEWYKSVRKQLIADRISAAHDKLIKSLSKLADKHGADYWSLAMDLADELDDPDFKNNMALVIAHNKALLGV